MTISSKPVLITGVTGYLAKQCALLLLENGYKVRGTVRSLSREAGLREALAPHTSHLDKLEICQADLTSDDGWQEAVSGCEFVLHVASPFPAGAPKDEDDLIVPAVQGTLRVLEASAAAGIKRVVLTSSIAAVSGGHNGHIAPFTEQDWSDTKEAIGAYPKSKTLAEQAAWKFVESHDLELAVINPGYILGPVLNNSSTTSNELHQRLMRREIPGIAHMQFNIVDVRDVAQAHLSAMTTPDANGKRFVSVAESIWLEDLAQILADHFTPLGYKIPTRRLPTILLKIAALFDETIKSTIGSLGKEYQYDTQQAQNILGWQPRPVRETLIEMGESLIEHQLV